jgi:hypothetical protein
MSAIIAEKISQQRFESAAPNVLSSISALNVSPWASNY